LRGRLRVPGDKSIGHRALLFAALAEGRSVIRGLSGGLDNRATAAAFRAMGVTIDEKDDVAIVEGVGLDGLRLPTTSIDCGNSGTTMRLLAGLLAAQRFGVRLVGDRSLESRPMRRVIDPLRARGCHIDGRHQNDDIYPPLAIAPRVEGEPLLGIEYEMPIASAQVKSALLLCGLYADGPTALKEPTVSRDHTERMMLALGVPIETVGSMVVLDPAGWNRRWSGFEWEVPGDLSGAAFMVAAASLVDGSEVVLERTGVNPTRSGIVDALRVMGAQTAIEWKGDAAGNEPIGDILARHAPLRPARVGGELLTRLIDEVPALCVLAAAAHGKTEIRDAAELRVKESDRLAAMAMILRAFGVPCEELEDGLIIEGGGPTRAATVHSQGDHRIAMASAVLALSAKGESVIDDVECVDTSFPGFAALLRELGADIEVDEG
jgi:3-phosphoshikimate 1-carboxyvinyltransferase